MKQKTLFFLITLFVMSYVGAAELYPNKVITIIVPYSAGGPTDTVARLVAKAMSVPLNGQIIIENADGAGGTIGAAKAAAAANDGYTLLLHHIGMSTAPALYRKLPFNPVNDFEPIGLINEVPMTLVARKDFPAKDLQELIAYIKANKTTVNLANAGLGSASQLCGMLLMSTLATEFTTIPYKGTAPAMNDLLGSQVDFMCDQTTNTTSQIKAGKIKVYGVTTQQRVASLPNVPTMIEAGLSNFEIAIWHGLYAPKGTPQSILHKLSQALQSALTDSLLKQRFTELGTQPVESKRATPAALRSHLQAEINKWGAIISKAGAYAD